MKRSLLVALLFVALFAAVGVVMAQEANQTTAAPAMTTTPAAPAMTAPVNVGNTVCPVSGNKIDEPGKYTVEYQGKVYNLCSAACKDEFMKDPDKYVAKVNEEMAKEQAAAAQAAPAATTGESK